MTTRKMSSLVRIVQGQAQALTAPLIGEAGSFSTTPSPGEARSFSTTPSPGEAQGLAPVTPLPVVVGKLPASPGNDPLLSEYWKNTAAFTTIQEKETQIKHYKRMNASTEVLQLVELESKPFGSVCEKIISELFGLGPRTSSQNDATLNGKKIEIKTARYWAGKDDCVWQHLEPDHDYDYAMFVLLNFHGWKVWCIKKTDLMDLRGKIVTFQGKQGWWTKKSAILPHLTPIHTLSQLHAFIQ